ncbi:carbonic anhydrase 7-like isoform X3 [Brevipalpus obovatus]|uniref:carbonic anhydrase 7-like isoform X3 n=1 Tax=Brevipalpus obovatus TaxID=246614 RepID=UPI003D9F7FFF
MVLVGILAFAAIKQSPINIIKNSCLKCVSKDVVNKYVWKYPQKIEKAELCNTGEAWMVSIPSSFGEKSVLQGQKRYQLKQFHAHWGCEPNMGTEHAIDGRYYASEIHFVHWDSQNYATAGEAAKNANGLAVIGVFVEIGNADHEELEKIVKLMDKIKYKDDKVTLSESLSLDKLFPDKHSYFTYPGSLTTKPYSENVTWIVLEQPIKASARQVARFRELFGHEDCDTEKGAHSEKLINNCREIQPLKGRQIYHVE